MASSRKDPDSYHSLRKRIKGTTVMGPQTEDDAAEIIEMTTHDVSNDGKEDGWVDSDEQSESASMLRPETVKESSVIQEPGEESFWLITFQVFFPFLIAGLGMVGAGLVLDIVQVSFVLYLIL